MWTSVCKAMLLLLCGLAASAGVASAQEDRVFVDPDSPSGKEYELPIDRAREEAAANRQKQGSAAGTQGTPLFGEGVEPDQERAVTGASTPGKPGTPDADAEDAAGGPRGTAGATADRTAQAAAPAGGTGLAAIIGAGAGVLVVGGLLGLVLRRRASR